MQVYAIRLFNFCRFGEKNNSVVFDLSDEQKSLLKTNSITFDQIYDEVMKNPVNHVKNVKERGIERYVGILGATDGDFDISNGCGKSSIVDGICYAHYDKVVRKLRNTDKNGDAGIDVVTKINNVIPEYIRESYVEELFEENGKIYRIKRGRTFSKSHKSSSPVLEFECISEGGIESEAGHRKGDTKKNIDEVNMMDYDLFTSTQMFAQNDSGKFLIGSDKIKKEMIIKMLKLEGIVKECLDEIRNRKNSQDKKLQNLRSNIELLEDSFLKSCRKFVDSIESYDEKNIDKVTSTIDCSMSLKQSEIEKYENEIKDVEKEITSLEKTDELSILKSVQEEGVNVKKEKSDKEKQIIDSTKELDANISDNYKIIIKKKEDKVLFSNKIDSFKSLKTEIDEFIIKFEVDNMTAKCEEYLAKIENAKRIKPDYEKQITGIENRKNSFSNDIAVLSSKISNKKEEIKDLKLQIDNNNDEKFICKYCKNDVDRHHIVNEVNKLNEEIKDIMFKKSTSDKCLVEINKELTDNKEKLNKIIDCISSEPKVKAKISDFKSKKIRQQELSESISDYTSQVTNLDFDISKIEENTMSLKTRKEDIKKTFDLELIKIEETLQDLRKRYEEAKNKANEIQLKIKTLNESKESKLKSKSALDKEIGFMSSEKVSLMIQNEDIKLKSHSIASESKTLERFVVVEDVYGLDGIQTRVIKKYLPLINVYVSEYMQILSEGNINISLDINSRSEIVFDISGNSASSFIMMSGGEQMLAHLAIDIGLALLAFSRLAKKPELICLDEIFGPLDNSHSEAVFEVLNKLSKIFNRIVIISHKDEIKKIIKNNIVVNKTSGINGLSEIKYLGEYTKK